MRAVLRRAGSVEFGLSLIARGIAAPLAFVANVLLARLLGPNAYGVYMTLLSAGLIAGGIGASGTGPLLTREIAATPSEGRANTVATISYWAMKFTAVTSVLALTVLAAWLLVGIGVPNVAWPDFVAIVGVVVMSVEIALVVGILAGLGRVAKSQAVVNFWKNAILLAAILALSALDIRHSVLAALGAQLVAYIAAIALGSFWLYRAYMALPRQAPTHCRDDQSNPSRETIRRWRQAAKHFFAGSAALLLLARVDVLIVNAIAGPETAGIFAAAARLGQLGTIAGITWIAWLQPRIALHARERNSTSLRHLLKVGLVGSMSMTVVLLGIGWISAPWLMSFLGPGFDAAILPFRWVLLGCLIWSPSVPFYVLLTMSGREALIARILWVQVVVTVSASVPLITHYGALGGAWAWFAGLCTASVLTVASAMLYVAPSGILRRTKP
jgi:O-antigen/teichoic acid export membrane protein